MGFVFQNFLLDPDSTARHNVALPLLLLNCSPRESEHDRPVARWRPSGLRGDLIDRPAAKLSGGQRQRVAFARAIAPNPPLVLADERPGNLDAQNRAGVARPRAGACATSAGRRS
jgi:ABC-type lipoprotein export system ATPase subunit